ncbi:TPA: LuxR C-terminal-related transcriptional regulator [Serratia fonticola]
MPRIMKILIVDPNQYFVAGLQQIVKKHFYTKGIAVNFLQQQLSYPMADLIFWAPGYPTTVMPIGLLVGDVQRSRLIILTSKESVHLVNSYVPCVFYRHQSQQDLIFLIDKALSFSKPGNNEEFIKECNDISLIPLSPRQKQVMRYISKGMCLSQIAEKLDINEKTVSSHKRTAMGKLQLSRTADIYHWLLSNATADNII